MTYAAIEQSTDLGSPITLFEFIYGDSSEDVYRYATTVDTIVAAGRIWEPFNISHSAIVSSGSLDRAELTVTMPSDTPLSDIFMITPPSRQLLLNIWRGHALTGEAKLDDFTRIWAGRVLSPNWTESGLELSCEAIATSLKRIGLRRYYQYGCAHVLYGNACKMVEADNTAYGYVGPLVNAQVVDMAITAFPAGFEPARLVGGTFNYAYESPRRSLRTITSVSVVGAFYRLVLMSAISNLEPGITATASYGCKHNWTACQQFGNTVNYGGCPSIPTKDPYRSNTF
jgi:hypothetical protein